MSRFSIVEDDGTVVQDAQGNLVKNPDGTLGGHLRAETTRHKEPGEPFLETNAEYEEES